MFPFQSFPCNCCKHWINPSLAARFLKRVWPFWDIMHWKVKVRNWKSSHQKCSIKKGVLKYFAKLTGKHLRQSLFFKKKKDSKNSIKKETLAQVFSCEFCGIFKKPFSQNTSERLLLELITKGLIYWTKPNLSPTKQRPTNLRYDKTRVIRQGLLAYPNTRTKYL